MPLAGKRRVNQATWCGEVDHGLRLCVFAITAMRAVHKNKTDMRCESSGGSGALKPQCFPHMAAIVRAHVAVRWSCCGNCIVPGSDVFYMASDGHEPIVGEISGCATTRAAGVH